MAKVTGPLLSLGGSGTIGKTMTFSTWRGVKYVRQRVVPENPNTTAQAETRNVFKMLVEAWKLLPTIGFTPWDTFALGRPFTGRNAFIGQNVAVLRNDVNLDDMIGSPGARGGLPPDSIVTAAGVATITVTFTQPGVPTGWTHVAAQAMVTPDQDASVAFVGPWVAAEDAATPFDTVVLAGLDTVLHQVFGWNKWTKPDGRTAYSVSLQSTETPT